MSRESSTKKRRTLTRNPLDFSDSKQIIANKRSNINNQINKQKYKKNINKNKIKQNKQENTSNLIKLSNPLNLGSGKKQRYSSNTEMKMKTGGKIFTKILYRINKNRRFYKR